MKPFAMNRRTMALLAVLVPLLGLFFFVALRSGPLAPVPVTVSAVEVRPVAPDIFGVGTVEAQYAYRIGPTATGRVERVLVEVGDRVKKGQLLVEMDPVDLDDRILAQGAMLRRAEAAVLAAEAGTEEAAARNVYAGTQADRYERLVEDGYVSQEAVDAKRQDRQVTQATVAAVGGNLDVARMEVARIRAERDGLLRQRANLKMVAPASGLVTARDVDPGTTVVAGQPVIQMIDPRSLWVSVRFDQLGAGGLRAGLPARIALRSRAARPVAGKVLRVEPMADAVTEELLAKVLFDPVLGTPPPIGELAEVTVALAASAPGPTVPNASIRRVEGRQGVWRIQDGRLRFTPVTIGAKDLDGRVRVLDGLKAGDRVVVYSDRALTAQSRIKVVERMRRSPR
ncbi:MAG: efflux RND transporter periplasmic adaptor subunit [Candidatus Eisenbacteria bacterium]